MYYGNMPLYPPLQPCEDGGCVRVPLFDDDGCAMPKPPPMRECRRVTLENPLRPGERAEVLLGLDGGGNLVICVRRDPRREDGDCGCLRPEPPRPCPRPEPPRRCNRPRCEWPERGCGLRLPPRRDCRGYRLYEG